jgi:hypothetical protein
MIRKFLAILGFAFGATCASAAVVKLDFQDLAGGIYRENLVSSGFTISPSCHTDVFDEAYVPDSSRVVGWDSSGCHSQDKLNAEYLGSYPVSYFSYLYFDYGGRPFSFLSFDYIGRDFSVFSSKGGVYNQDICLPWERDCFVFHTITMDGPDWTGVKWIMFGYMDPGAPALRLDNLVFRVPAPGTGVLALGGGLLLWASRRRVRHQAS